MLSSLPLLLSTLAHCLSAAGDVIVQLCHYSLLYADVIINWLLANLLVYVSIISSHLSFVLVYGDHSLTSTWFMSGFLLE